MDNVPEFLFSNMRYESFSGSDTNRVSFLTFSDSASQVFFKLTNVPLSSSLQGIQQAPMAQVPMVNFGNERNFVFAYFVAGADIKGSIFHLQYMMDMRHTNLWKKVEIIDGKVFMDGVRIWFKQGSDYH